MSKTQMWIAGAVAAVCAVIAAGWFLLLAPQRSDASQLRGDAATEQQANQALVAQVALLKKQETQLPAEQARIAAITSKIPADPALPAYVRFLNSAAGATNVDLVSVAPSAPTTVQVAAVAPARPAASASASPSAGTTSRTAAPAGLPLSAINVTITVNGDYFGVEQFLSKMEQGSRSTVVSSVAIQPGEPPKPKDSSSGSTATGGAAQTQADEWRTLTAQITASIFMSDSPQTGAATSGASAPAGVGTTAGN